MEFDTDNIELSQSEFLFWGAIKTGLVTYTEASDMYADELLEVIKADLYFKKLFNESLEESLKNNL